MKKLSLLILSIFISTSAFCADLIVNTGIHQVINGGGHDYDNIVIHEGAQLTIQGGATVTLTQGSAITVKGGSSSNDGGILRVIENSTIKAYSTVWSGIIVEGRSDKSQWRTSGRYWQGRAFLKDCEIIQCTQGIRNGTGDDIPIAGFPSLKVKNRGGIVMATNVYFGMQATYFLQFEDYENFNPSNDEKVYDVSRFVKCEFDFSSNNTSGYINLRNVWGLRFLGCEFNGVEIDDGNKFTIQGSGGLIIDQHNPPVRFSC